MTDELDPPDGHNLPDEPGAPDEYGSPEPHEHGSPEPASASASPNGRSRSQAPTVRSGLAQRRSPVLVALGDFAQGARRTAMRDPLALFLALASLGLAIAFATLLGDIKPSSAGTP